MYGMEYLVEAAFPASTDSIVDGRLSAVPAGRVSLSSTSAETVADTHIPFT